MKLSPKERAFCREYVTLREGQAAATKAGYSAKTARSKASQLLTKVNIKQEIARLNSKLEEKSLITKQRVLDELALVGFSDMADCITVGSEGQVQVKTFEEMPKGASRAISRIKEKRSIRQSQDEKADMIIDLQLEYGHHNKVDALKEIAKMNGYYPDTGTGEAVTIVRIHNSAKESKCKQ
jgi:phage terminase small subunit